LGDVQYPLSASLFSFLILSYLLLLAAHHQCRPDMLAASSNHPKSEGERYCGPHPHQGLYDDSVYLNFLQEVTHYPNDRGHGPSATVNTLSPVDENPLPSRVDSGPLSSLAEPPDLNSSLHLFDDHQDLLVEGTFFTKGPSSPPSMKRFRGVHEPLLTMVSLGSSPELLLHVFGTDKVKTFTSRQLSSI
jgi:hypothetical protein